MLLDKLQTFNFFWGFDLYTVAAQPDAWLLKASAESISALCMILLSNAITLHSDVLNQLEKTQRIFKRVNDIYIYEMENLK